MIKKRLIKIFIMMLFTVFSVFIYSNKTYAVFTYNDVTYRGYYLSFDSLVYTNVLNRDLSRYKYNFELNDGSYTDNLEEVVDDSDVDVSLIYVRENSYDNITIMSIDGVYSYIYDQVYYIYIQDGDLVFYDQFRNIIIDYTNTSYTEMIMFRDFDDNLPTDYDNAYYDGYNQARVEYGYYDGSNYIPAGDYGLERYNDGLNDNRDYFGINYNGNWLTAEQWGDIQFVDGYDKGLSTEIDWFSWSMTFFLMPFRILNIEILPGIRIGYFALFSLLLGVVGWFFFIVGKGGGRKK